MHESFRQTVRALNDNPILLNTTRVDTDLQYAKTDRYDAYQRICTEVQYRWERNVAGDVLRRDLNLIVEHNFGNIH